MVLEVLKHEFLLDDGVDARLDLPDSRDVVGGLTERGVGTTFLVEFLQVGEVGSFRVRLFLFLHNGLIGDFPQRLVAYG